MFAKSYSSHTAHGRKLDVDFVIESLQPEGHWNQLFKQSAGDMTKLVRTMPTSAPATASTNKQGKKVKVAKAKRTATNDTVDGQVAQQEPQADMGELLVSTEAAVAALLLVTVFVCVCISIGSGHRLLTIFAAISGTLMAVGCHMRMYPEFWLNVIKILLRIAPEQEAPSEAVKQINGPIVETMPVGVVTPVSKQA